MLNGLRFTGYGHAPAEAAPAADPLDKSGPDLHAFDTAHLSNVVAKPVLDIRQITIPATVTGWLLRLPAAYEFVTFYFPTAPGSAITFGPNAPTIAVAAISAFIIPGTTNLYQFDNPNAAYVLQVFGVIGYAPVVVTI